jgi:kynureninase
MAVRWRPVSDAAQLDAADPAPGRDEVLVPVSDDGTPAAYMAGNSLGLQPEAAAEALGTELGTWARLGVEGWSDGDHPWLGYAATLTEPMGRIVGADPSEVVVMNTLTINLHLLLASFYRPAGGRTRIVVEEHAFPSDAYAVWSHCELHGLDPASALVRVATPADVPGVLDDTTAVVVLAGVSYLSGELADVARITAAVHDAGAVAIWDMAHAAGNVPLDLRAWDVDAACWCTYKYLNGGPGAPGAAFVHQRHHDRFRLAGWWGNDEATRFVMAPEFAAAPGAAGFAVSTPTILGLAPLRAALAQLDAIGMAALRARSIRLTAYLERELDAAGAEIVTPRDPARRGAQLSVRTRDARGSCERMRLRHGVICDAREPDIVRFAPAPLYTSYGDCSRAAAAFAACR